MSYIKISCQVEKKVLDLLTTYFFNQGCLGTEIIDTNTDYEDKYGEIYPSFEDEIIPFDDVIIIAYFNDININYFNQFIKDNSIKLLSFKIEEFQSESNEKKYQENFQELKICDDISIIPPWFNDYNKDKMYIIIEPGTGFGTGYHLSTQLAIKNLLKYHHNFQSMLDFGTGSGILAIIGKKLGIKKVFAIDIDELALKNAVKNAKLNQLDIIFENKSIEIFHKKVNIIIANIVYDVIVKTIDDVKRCLDENGIYIISGILGEQKADLINILKTNDFEITEIVEEDNWISIVTKLVSKYL